MTLAQRIKLLFIIKEGFCFFLLHLHILLIICWELFFKILLRVSESKIIPPYKVYQYVPTSAMIGASSVTRFAEISPL